jgi:hypothetical protein
MSRLKRKIRDSRGRTEQSRAGDRAGDRAGEEERSGAEIQRCYY